MNEVRFLVHRRARLSYESLTPTEREALEHAIAPLVELPVDRWGEAGAIRLDSPEPLYLLRIDDSLRAIIRPVAGKPEIEDFVHRETLELYFKEAAKPAARS